MRDYSIVSARFWIGETGKALRDDREAQVLALYLITSPHASMSGVYYCPKQYMAQDTGMALEGASKGLRRLQTMGFCEYDEAAEMVFVIRMARFQIGESLRRGDNRRVGLIKELARLPKTLLVQRFFDEYHLDYNLTPEEMPGLHQAASKPLPSPSRGASEPPGSQDQDQEQEQDQDTGAGGRRTPPPPQQPSLLDSKEPPQGASPRLVDIYQAMQNTTFLVPGVGEQSLWDNTKRPRELAARFDTSFPGVNVPQLIQNLAGWTIANPTRAKRDLGRFVWNAATRDQDKPRRPSDDETYRHGSDLEAKVKGARRGGR